MKTTVFIGKILKYSEFNHAKFSFFTFKNSAEYLGLLQYILDKNTCVNVCMNKAMSLPRPGNV